MKTSLRAGLAVLLLSSAGAFGAESSAPTASSPLADTPSLPILPDQSLLRIPKSEFKSYPGDPTHFIYVKPGANLQHYKSVLVAPLVVLQKETGTQWRAVVSDEKGLASRIFQDAMNQALKDKGIRVADQPGPDVVTLRVAVTRVRQNTEGFVPSDILPVKIIFNVARLAAGMQKYMVKIDALGQLQDSQSGQLLAGGFGVRQQSKSGEKPVSLADFSDWAKDWSQDMAGRLARQMPSLRDQAGGTAQ
jgi:hypothetical protein